MPDTPRLPLGSPRFLIGNGERLTETVKLTSGGGGLPPPYELPEARSRIAPQLGQASAVAQQLPPAACPADRVVSLLTMHPSFVAKSSFPAQLLRAGHLRAVGSRPRQITPSVTVHQVTDKQGGKTYERRPGREERPTIEFFVESTRTDLRDWATHLQDETETLEPDERDIVIVEQFRMPSTAERSRLPSGLPDEIPLEVVLHAAGNHARYGFVLDAFRAYALTLGAEPYLDRRLDVGGLCFVPVLAPASRLEELARFSFLRVVRPVPRLRVLDPADSILRSVQHVEEHLPKTPPVDPDLRVAVFDGGVSSNSVLAPWATARVTPDLGAPMVPYVDHGTRVISALLFGPIDPDSDFAVPYSHVDHYRVLDSEPIRDPYELFDVFKRIEAILTQNEYEFVNLSIGPEFPIEDDEVHSWTAFLDTHLADGQALMTVATGNNGWLDRPTGNARIQIPSDAVNALSLGAASSQGNNWDRASYSPLGPGRTPASVKPDVLAFGGTAPEPFLTVSAQNELVESCGTSFAAPLALRTAVGVRALFGNRLGPLALKALLVHTATQHNPHDPVEHGWGRIRTDLQQIVLCGDGVARVVYQGTLTPGKYLRAQLPVPSAPLRGNVTITATVAYATEVEPDYLSHYTRSGLELVFRPHADRSGGPNSTVAKSKSFFKRSPVAATATMSSSAQQWETVRHTTSNMRGSSLHSPVFDIHYNARSEGHDGTSQARKVRYAMVITVESKHMPDLYNEVLRTYPNRLAALQPRLGFNLDLRTGAAVS